MKIKSLHIKNFKRFSDLEIDLNECAISPKLVLLIGANGSGKSTIFDAFELISLYSQTTQWSGGKDLNYYVKKGTASGSLNLVFSDDKFIKSELLPELNGGKVESNSNLTATSFYGRSAIRYLPRLTRTTVGNSIDIISNFDKPKYYIDTDNRFENDIDVLVKRIIDQIFSGVFDSDSQQLSKVRDFLVLINQALPRIFGDDNKTSLKFVRPITPADGKPVQLIFQKGQSEINYDLLSSGEKEVINILFNLFIRTPNYQDTIYFFDELDAHLHTSLQYNLLKEITENWIPENCQIWTASHSLGFIQYAKENENAAIIDFDHFDFDEKIVLTPQKSSEIFDIAVPKEALSILFRDKRKIFCENQNAFLYNSIGIENTLFLGDSNKNSIFLRIEQEQSVDGLIDRDYLTDDESRLLTSKFPNLYILKYYCFENYILHPDNLGELDPNFDKEIYIKNIIQEKNDSINNILRTLDNDRNSYLFFKKEKNILKNNTHSFTAIKSILESDDFDTFYPSFSMKKKHHLCKLHNINDEKLIKTTWFKSKIEEILK